MIVRDGRLCARTAGYATCRITTSEMLAAMRASRRGPTGSRSGDAVSLRGLDDWNNLNLSVRAVSTPRALWSCHTGAPGGQRLSVRLFENRADAAPSPLLEQCEHRGHRVLRGFLNGRLVRVEVALGNCMLEVARMPGPCAGSTPPSSRQGRCGAVSGRDGPGRRTWRS